MSLLRARARFATSLVVCVGPREVNNLAAGAEKQKVCILACRCLGPREVNNLAAGAEKQNQAAMPLIGIVRPPRPELAESGRHAPNWHV